MTMLQTTLLLASVWTPSQADAGDAVDYLREVKPILAARCYTCHGAIKQKAGLRLIEAEVIERNARLGNP